MLNPRIEMLIQRQMSGKILPDESDELSHWKNRSTDNKQVLDEVAKIWELSIEDELGVDIDSAWLDFKWRMIERRLIDIDVNKV